MSDTVIQGYSEENMRDNISPNSNQINIKKLRATHESGTVIVSQLNMIFLASVFY